MIRRQQLLEPMGMNGIREFNYVLFLDTTGEPLEIHTHPDAMEICFLYCGRQTYRVGNQDYHLNGLDIFVAYPNEEHSTGNKPEEKSTLYYMIVDTVHEPGRFLGMADPAIAYVPRALNQIPRRLFRGTERVRTLWEEVYQLIEQPHPLRTILIRQRLLDLLLEILQCANRSEWQPTEDIAKTTRYIRDHVREYLRMETLAEISGLSLSRFKAKFRLQMGMPPGEYVLRERVECAKDLLRDGMSVTEVAYALNFSSSQHFSTCFRRFCGMTPSKMKKSGKPIEETETP